MRRPIVRRQRHRRPEFLFGLVPPAEPSVRAAELAPGAAVCTVERDGSLRLAQRAIVAALAVIDHRQHDVGGRVCRSIASAWPASSPARSASVASFWSYSNLRQYASARSVCATGSRRPDVLGGESSAMARSTFACLSYRSSSARACASGALVRFHSRSAVATATIASAAATHRHRPRRRRARQPRARRSRSRRRPARSRRSLARSLRGGCTGAPDPSPDTAPPP